MEYDRYLRKWVEEDLREKMVFVGGPRQVGKTWFALNILGGTKQHPAYLNWDFDKDKGKIVRADLPERQPLVVFDEIHKYAKWRNLLKGLYDKMHPRINFLVTGSARLDHYRKGGDSLQGRYHYYRLHPFSLREFGTSPSKYDLKHLLKFGGFPEPCMRATEVVWRRWQAERTSRVIDEDLRDLEHLRDVTILELLLSELPQRVGSPLSIENLRVVLEVAHHSVSRWIRILENLYICFRIPPYGASKIRAVKKEQKLYFWDWSQAPEEGGARFENLVASQLLKYCHLIEDTEGYRMEVRFLRDTDKREIDFVVLKEKTPLFAVECKSGEKQVSAAMHYFAERTPIPYFYQVHLGEKDYLTGKKNVRVLPFTTFCKELGMP